MESLRYITVIRYLIFAPKVKLNKFTVRNAEVIIKERNFKRLLCAFYTEKQKKKKKKKKK